MCDKFIIIIIIIIVVVVVVVVINLIVIAAITVVRKIQNRSQEAKMAANQINWLENLITLIAAYDHKDCNITLQMSCLFHFFKCSTFDCAVKLENFCFAYYVVC